jgi:hypothetical protein
MSLDSRTRPPIADVKSENSHEGKMFLVYFKLQMLMAVPLPTFEASNIKFYGAEGTSGAPVFFPNNF